MDKVLSSGTNKEDKTVQKIIFDFGSIDITKSDVKDEDEVEK
jgi:hypothetical protein